MTNQKGFTLIELLVVIAIILVIVAIAIPNMLNAIQRGKQKRTMADMRAIGTAVQAFSVDYNRYPSIYGTEAFRLWPDLEPVYIKKMPTQDGWGNQFSYVANNTDMSQGATNADSYTIQSYGKDGSSENCLRILTSNFNNDICYSSGTFIQFPEGMQQ